jgi:(1->4)-alpha-D-glucan 1-alpha-D-glucosylmutase
MTPDPNEEYFIYQTLVGAWPFDAREEPSFHGRLNKYLIKALREAKVHTSWLSPDEEYEAGVLQFVQTILDPRRPFVEAFRPFQSRMAELGIYNSLAQLLVKVTAPGVPDFYQGTELWDLSLVDPDNRHPVDYEKRRALLEEIDRGDSDRLPDSLLAHRADGRVKLLTMVRALAARTAQPALFQKGEYVPLETTGTRRQCLFAFARRLGAAAAITCVPRLVATLVPEANRPPLGPDVWQDTQIDVSGLQNAGMLRDALTGGVVAANEGTLEAARVFQRFPVALLVASPS